MPRDLKSDTNTEMLEGRIAVLEALVLNLTQSNATQNILDSGFKRISSRLKTVSQCLEGIAYQVAPLRNLGNESPHLRPDQQAVMDNLYLALLPPQPTHAITDQPDDKIQVGNQLRSAS